MMWGSDVQGVWYYPYDTRGTSQTFTLNTTLSLYWGTPMARVVSPMRQVVGTMVTMEQ
jgi:hypothetical protein